MFAPSIRWQPTPDTDVVLTGLYHEDDTGSTSQFLPIVGTFRPNPVAGEQLDRYTFVGKAGRDRYAGRSLQGGVDHASLLGPCEAQPQGTLHRQRARAEET